MLLEKYDANSLVNAGLPQNLLGKITTSVKCNKVKHNILRCGHRTSASGQEDELVAPLLSTEQAR